MLKQETYLVPTIKLVIKKFTFSESFGILVEAVSGGCHAIAGIGEAIVSLSQLEAGVVCGPSHPQLVDPLLALVHLGVKVLNQFDLVPNFAGGVTVSGAGPGPNIAPTLPGKDRDTSNR